MSIDTLVKKAADKSLIEEFRPEIPQEQEKETYYGCQRRVRKCDEAI